MESVLIRHAGPRDAVVAMIEGAGGTVTRRYKHLGAVAARVPRASLALLDSLLGSGAISKDPILPAPAPLRMVHDAGGFRPITDEARAGYGQAHALSQDRLAALAVTHPDAYLINGVILNAAALHARGITGQGVIVAVIDSGIKPGYPHLESDGSVIGGEDFVGDGRGFSNRFNGGHGTFVAGMISANVEFDFDPASTFFRAVQANAPAAIVPPSTIPMIGSAPRAGIYALRVFPPSGGSPTSRVLAALDRALELREMFDRGEPGGVNIGVVNMSLSGATLFAGRDLLDTFVTTLVERDIVVVCSAGNSGPSSLTIGSPSSAFGAITTGAASLAHNERIFIDLVAGLGFGPLYRPFAGTQTAYFSSRGPDADGRPDPDVVASGVASFGQGFFPAGFISLEDGTSFSSPTVAGVAALLRQAFPAASARQVRNAIIASADPSRLADGSAAIDQGRGYVNALATYDLLASGAVPDALPEPPRFERSVKRNVKENAGLQARGGHVQQHFGDLLPGQRAEVLYDVPPDTRQVLVALTNVTPSLPPDQQNYFFGDDLLFSIHSAKTSNQQGVGGYYVLRFTRGGTFAIDDPEKGLMRVTLSGDWTNAGLISADLDIVAMREPLPKFTAEGTIAETETVTVPIDVPEGVTEAEFRLIWKADWSDYPTNDVDLILVGPTGTPNFDGATLAIPETVVVGSPLAGRWLALINGFELHTPDDRYRLRVSLDGKVVKLPRDAR